MITWRPPPGRPRLGNLLAHAQRGEEWLECRQIRCELALGGIHYQAVST